MSAAEDAEYLAMVERQRARALAEVERLKALAEAWRCDGRPGWLQLRAALSSPQAQHEFDEDVNDASMCMCGIPAITHDLVQANERTAPQAEQGPGQGSVPPTDSVPSTGDLEPATNPLAETLAQMPGTRWVVDEQIRLLTAEVAEQRATIKRLTNIAGGLEETAAQQSATIERLQAVCCEHGNMCDLGAWS